MVLPLLPLLAIGALVGGYGSAAIRPDKVLPGGETSYPPPLKETPEEREDRRLEYLAEHQAFEELKAQRLAALRRRKR